MKHILVVVALSATLASLPQPGFSLVRDSVRLPIFPEDIPASVSAIASGGHWAQGGVEGFFRTAVFDAGVEDVNQTLFLQWIAVLPKIGAYRLHSSVPIAEINGDHAEPYLVRVAPAPGDGDHFSFSVFVTRTRSGDTAGYKLVPAQEPGKYDLNPR